MSAKYKSPSFLLPNELNTSANPLNTDGDSSTGTGVNSLYSMDLPRASASYIDLGTIDITGDCTISFWINFNSISHTLQKIFFAGTSASDQFSIGFATTNQGVAVNTIFASGQEAAAGTKSLSNNSISTNTWYNVVITKTTGIVQNMYLNGVDDTNTPTGFWWGGAPNVTRIGDSGSNALDAKIDEVAIFNRALTDGTGGTVNEIAALYDGTGSNIRPSNLMASNLNPIAYYPLGEQAQNTGYPSATGNEWQFPNGVLQDYVMDFDGATIGDYIDVGDIPLEGVYTISFWINPDATPSSISFLLDKGDGGSNISVRVTQRNNNAIRFQIGSSYLESTDTLTNNSWNNVILIANGSSSKIYINNGTSPNGTLTTAPNTTQSLLIGTDEGRQSTYYFNGQMSNVVIWNTDQSANIDDIYNNGSPQTSYTVTPQNWWKLNATSVYTPSAPNYTTALDFSSTGFVKATNNVPLTGNSSVSCWFQRRNTVVKEYIWTAGQGSGNSITGLVGESNVIKPASNLAGFSYSVNGFNTGDWIHSVLTYDGTNTTLFINGIQVATTTSITNNLTASSDINIGNWNRYGNNSVNFAWSSGISNLACFDSALTASQVSTLFNFGTPQSNISFSPLSWYKLDNTTTGLNDLGSGGANASISGTGITQVNKPVVVTPSWKIPTALTIPSINYTTALDFDPSGSGDYISFGNQSAFKPTSNYTFSIWFNGASSSYAFFGTNSSAGTGVHALLTGTKILYYHGNQSVMESNHGGLNIWHNFTVTWSASTGILRSFIDGKYATQKVGVNSITWSNDLEVGRYNGGQFKYDGKLSNFAMWNTTLTDGFSGTPSQSQVAGGQVAEIYNNGQPQASITGSPVGWWKLDDQNTITDYSGNNYTGTNNGALDAPGDVTSPSFNIPVNGVSTTLPSTALQQSDLQFDSPYSNYSLNFDGTGDYITVTQDFSSYTSMSVSGWVRTASTSQYQYLFSTGVYNGGTPGNGQGFGIGFDNTGKFAAWAGGANYFTFGSVSANTWYHVIQTITGTTLRFYVNGVLTSTQTVGSFNIPSSAIAVIGAYSGNSIPTQSNLYGKADELSIFNYELTTSQVLEIYNNGRPKDLTTFSGTAPTNWWRLGENAYFDNNSFIVPNSISGAPNGTGSGTITTMISADAPGTYANGVGENLAILDRVGDAALSTSNSQSYNMIPSDISPYVPQYVGDQIANNSSMTFDGTNYFDCGNDSSLTPINEISISLWIKTNTTSQTQFSGPLDKHVSGTGGYQFFFPNSSSSEIKFALGNPKVSLTSTTQVGDTNWHHILATCDNVNCKLYIDGVLESTVSANLSTLSNSENLKIGGDGVSTFYFNGQIDEVAIFDTALNAGQIYNDIYQPTASAPGNNQAADLVNNPNLPNPVAWYRMGD